MGSLIANNARFRHTFAKIPQVLEVQNLIEIQRKSYEDFLQLNSSAGDRRNNGLQAVFHSVFPIQDFNQTASLQFVSYGFDKPKYEVDECRERGMTYSAPLKVTVRLVVWDVDEDSDSQNIRDIKEQEVYFGDLPIMTENGTFIVNGTERVVVSQLHRSPGIFFDQDKGKTSYSGKVIFSARVIPNRGSWLDFEFDSKDILHVRIDRRRKLPATVLLRALGFDEEQLLDYFYDHEQVYVGAAIPQHVDPDIRLAPLAQKTSEKGLGYCAQMAMCTAISAVVDRNDLEQPPEGKEWEAKDRKVASALSKLFDSASSGKEQEKFDTLVKAIGDVAKVPKGSWDKEQNETAEWNWALCDQLSSRFGFIADTEKATKTYASSKKHLDQMLDKGWVGVLLGESPDDVWHWITVLERDAGNNRYLIHDPGQSSLDLVEYESDEHSAWIDEKALKEFWKLHEQLGSYTKGFVHPREQQTEVPAATADAGLHKNFNPELHKGTRTTVDIVDPESGDVMIKAGKKLGSGHIRRMGKAGVERLPLNEEDVIGMAAAHDVVDMNTGEVIAECNEEITEEVLQTIRDRSIDQVTTLFIDHVNVGSFLRDTLLVDKVDSSEDAIIEIYRRLRPGDPPTYETALAFFENLFFNSERYDLSRVGRLKMNHKLTVDVPLEQTTLTREDIMRTVRYLIELRNGRGVVDDIDHLGNRRVRAVGELLENQFRIGLVRMEKAIKERMSLSEIETLMPHDLINAKPVSAVVKEFFGSSQLSQFMDQTNPLSEITHKRRLSALGPGGLTRERAGFDVRDVHPTHYGRICPIETPEGPNIGLIASLSTYARVNEYGFIETPYRLVDKGTVTNNVRFHSALEEEGKSIAQASAPLSGDGSFVEPMVNARTGGEPMMTRSEEVNLMDISPNQLVSVAASLIPFLEHDDANRALMGSNMQRQAVPLVNTQAPFVGTGIERFVARDSGVTALARRSGKVEYVDASRIVIRADETAEEIGGEVDIYHLIKYRRSNQNTCINQKPIVRVGDHVANGGVIADGPATDTGELALGQNVTVAFMPWGGFNFEDSILISERLVRDDVFTSIHIEEFEIASRDTKLGKEEITCDIPNVGDEALADLDESGIVRIGAEVRSSDILVGKITPKGETQLSPEEKLLRAIFGEKAGDVRDTSLRVPPGVAGTVIGAQIFSREGVEKDERAKQIQEEHVTRILKDKKEEMGTVVQSARVKLWGILDGKNSSIKMKDDNTGEILVDKGKPFTQGFTSGVAVHRWIEIGVQKDSKAEDGILKVIDQLNEQTDLLDEVFEQKIARLKRGDELPPGVIKLVKVYIAIKRKLSVGDKMAGRHGNKGVISKILPDEDMPYQADGRPVDIVLNPLGVPSRMNVGQILETHLGWAAKGIAEQINLIMGNGATGKAIKEYVLHAFPGSAQIADFVKDASDDELLALGRKLGKGVFLATPVFEGASEAEIKTSLRAGGMPERGQITLFNGLTGDAFDTKVTVGVMYMLKLHHLVDDKIHARSIGPYSLVTQQPLGGKAQFGGQRLGEMEVWAMEAYGAAHALQEFLTVKSDDVAGRTRMYESIVKGENMLEAGLPESFNVLVKELQSLALNVQLIEEKQLSDAPP